MSFVAQFLSATEAPIVKNVIWPKTLAHDHPLRKLSLFVRFWPAAVQAVITDAVTSDKKNWVEPTFHYIIAATICDEKGVPVFNEIWPQIWKDHVEAVDRTIAINVAQNRKDFEAASSSTLPPLKGLPVPDPVGQYDERKQLVIPPPDYHLIGAWLKAKYDSRQGQEILGTLWDAAMDYNGFKAESSKNSETTETSEPSTAVQ